MWLQMLYPEIICLCFSCKLSRQTLSQLQQLQHCYHCYHKTCTRHGQDMDKTWTSKSWIKLFRDILQQAEHLLLTRHTSHQNIDIQSFVAVFLFYTSESTLCYLLLVWASRAQLTYPSECTYWEQASFKLLMDGMIQVLIKCLEYVRS